ncbi:MAG: type II toxin-antitoxin system VapC family toxin [bacterium]
MVFDTMFFIYLFEDVPKYAELCETVLAEVADGYCHGVVTPITAGEVIVKPLRQGRTDIADRYRGALRGLSNITPVPISMDIGSMAGALRAKYKLPMPDMIQVATALQGDRPAIVTNDRHLKKVSEVQVHLLDDML